MSAPTKDNLVGVTYAGEKSGLGLAQRSLRA